MSIGSAAVEYMFLHNSRPYVEAQAYCQVHDANDGIGKLYLKG